MFGFWFFIIVCFIIACLLGCFLDRVFFASEKSKPVILGAIVPLMYCIYIPILCAVVAIPHGDNKDKCKMVHLIPYVQNVENVVFVDAEDVVLSGELFCPYVRPFVFAKSHIDLSYTIQADSVDVSYSKYYTEEFGSTYRWMGRKLRKQQINDLPIASVTGVKDGAEVNVVMNAHWSRIGIFEVQRTMAMSSRIYVVPREEGQTFENWKNSCRHMIKSISGADVLAYVFDGTVEMPSGYLHDGDKVLTQDELSGDHVTCDLPQRKRRIDLRQDTYRTCTHAPVNVTDVKVSGLVEGGILAQIYFDPAETEVETNFLFQYYTDAKKTGDALIADYRHVVIEPGQTSVNIIVKDGYDQFAFLGFVDQLARERVKLQQLTQTSLVSLPNTRLADILLGTDYVDINEHTRYYLDDRYSSSGELQVDHRQGFLQHIIYRADNVFDWFNCVFLVVILLGAAYFGVTFMIEILKK